LNDCERASNKNWTMLFVYRSVWNDMVSQQKTRLAKLRAMLGSMGSESAFPKIVGLSASWIKKASAGNLPMTARAASAIHDATGVDLGWIMGDAESGEPLEHGGKPYTLESYSRWKYTKDESKGDYARLYNPVSMRMILRVLANVSAGKKQTAASCELFEFAQKFKATFGAAETSGEYGADLLKEIARLEKPPAPQDNRPLEERIIKGRQAPTPTPQKKQPSRRSKRPGGH
jgi:hypothetical protein